jgi:hypothetical protein
VPFKIQRVPRGLQNLLSTSGGNTPVDLEDRVQASLDLLQFYGATQLNSAFDSAVIVEGGSVSMTLNTTPASVPTPWVLLYALWATVLKTATMTAGAAAIELNRGTTHNMLVAAKEVGPFGATESGNIVFGGLLPYPLLCPPGSVARTRLNILGTDANATCSIFAEFGVLN